MANNRFFKINEQGFYEILPTGQAMELQEVPPSDDVDPSFGISLGSVGIDPSFGAINLGSVDVDPYFGNTVDSILDPGFYSPDYQTTTNPLYYPSIVIDSTIDHGISPGAVSVGDFSDGYHTFNELYEHRTALFAILCRTYPERAWKSCFHSDGEMFDGMFIAGLETPEGTYTYHCENKYWAMFDGVPELTRSPEWDGHEPKDYGRLFSLLKVSR